MGKNFHLPRPFKEKVWVTLMTLSLALFARTEFVQERQLLLAVLFLIISIGVFYIFLVPVRRPKRWRRNKKEDDSFDKDVR